MERKNAWKEYTEAEVSELEKLNESYRKFLDARKDGARMCETSGCDGGSSRIP